MCSRFFYILVRRTIDTPTGFGREGARVENTLNENGKPESDAKSPQHPLSLPHILGTPQQTPLPL